MSKKKLTFLAIIELFIILSMAIFIFFKNSKNLIDSKKNKQDFKMPYGFSGEFYSDTSTLENGNEIDNKFLVISGNKEQKIFVTFRNDDIMSCVLNDGQRYMFLDFAIHYDIGVSIHSVWNNLKRISYKIDWNDEPQIILFNDDYPDFMNNKLE